MPSGTYTGHAGTEVRAIRISVAALGFLAVLAVLAVLVLGSESDAQPGTGLGGSRPIAAGGFDGGGGDGATASPSADGSGSGSSTGGGASSPAPPLPPELLAPVGSVPVAPTEFNAVLAWRVPGPFAAQVEAYTRSFPVPGYRLGNQRLFISSGGGGWDIERELPGPQPNVSLLYIKPDPTDPNFTIVEAQLA